MESVKTNINLISERVKNYRIDFQLTQKQLAEKSGVSIRSIQNFEKGGDIQLSNLIKILNALELDKNIEVLVPNVAEKPSSFIGKKKIRKRVRTSNNESSDNRIFKWGDEL